MYRSVMAQAMLPSWLVGNLSYGDLCVAVSNGRSAIHWCQGHHLIPNNTIEEDRSTGIGCSEESRECLGNVFWWKCNNQLPAITGLAHQTVNHSLHFVDPISGAHTQGVEAMWSSCKRMLREERTMHSKLFVTYLPEFMWRRRFGGPSTFSLKHIAEQYP